LGSGGPLRGWIGSSDRRRRPHWHPESL